MKEKYVFKRSYFILVSLPFQLNAAKKEIDQLDHDMQKKIKALEQIVRYGMSFNLIIQLLNELTINLFFGDNILVLSKLKTFSNHNLTVAQMCNFSFIG